MASLGRSMGLALHDEESSRVSDQLAWVSNSVSLGVVNLLSSNIWLGGQGWPKKNKLTRRAVPCFFVEDARTSRTKSFGHTKLNGASAGAASRIDLSNESLCSASYPVSIFRQALRRILSRTREASERDHWLHFEPCQHAILQPRHFPFTRNNRPTTTK